jgi:hypothetical protein
MAKVFKEVHNVYHSALRPFIKDYFVVGYSDTGQDGLLPDLVPPTASVVVHFSIGDTTFAYDEIERTNRVSILGLQTRHINVIPQAGTHIIGANFYPYGFSNLFNISASLLTNSVLAATEIWDRAEVEQLEQKLAQVVNVEEGIYLIEKFFWKQRETAKYGLYFDSFVDKLVEVNGINKGCLFPSTHSISRRSLERYFAEKVGCAPKKYANLLRHIYILKEMFTQTDGSFSQLVEAGQYYDCSHLQKDFKMHTGITYLSLIHI